MVGCLLLVLLLLLLLLPCAVASHDPGAEVLCCKELRG
jgi:hypothetical protein